MGFRWLVGLLVVVLASCGGQGVPGNGNAPSGGTGTTPPTGEGTYLVAGVVSGAALGTTTVSLTPASGVSVSTVADANGAYSFALPAIGNYTIAPSNQNYSFAPSQSTISVTPATTGRAAINFSATSSYSISGVVGGAATSGVQVVVYGTGSGSPLIATTDANGFFKVSGLSKGSYTVIPNLAGYNFNPSNAVVVINTNSSAGNNFSSTVSTTGGNVVNATISGTVSGAATGGVTVNLYSTQSPTPLSTVTDASGFFMFSGLTGGTYTIIPNLAGFGFSPANGSVTITNASSTGNNFASVAGSTLATNNKLSGMVSGSIAAGVTVILHGPNGQLSAVSDATGYYEFAGLTNGSYTVVPTLSGYSFNPSSSVIPINGANYAGANFSSVAGTIVTSKTLSGIITGQVTQGVTVNLYGTQTGTAVSDVNGYFEFTGLSDGPYTLIPTMAGVAFTPSNRVATISGASVARNDFSTITTVHAIKGTIPNLPGVTLTLAGPTAATTTTDAVGNYVFNGLVNADYIITPSLAQYTFNPTSSTVTLSNIDSAGVNFIPTFIAIPTYTISGHLANRKGLPGNTVTLSGAANATAITDAAGFYQFTGLVAGDYTVTPSSAYPGVTYNPASSSFALNANRTVDFAGYDTINLTIAANTPNWDAKTALITAGWDGVTPIYSTVTINAGVVMYSTSNAVPAVSIVGIFPANSQITLINNGNIYGAGGDGMLYLQHPTTWAWYYTQPTSGGTALKINASVPVFVSNNGTIKAGGGGSGGVGAFGAGKNGSPAAGSGAPVNPGCGASGTVSGGTFGVNGVTGTTSVPDPSVSCILPTTVYYYGGLAGAATQGAATATWNAIGTIVGAQN